MISCLPLPLSFSRPTRPAFSGQEKLAFIREEAESFEKSPDAIDHQDSKGQAVRTVPGQGSLTRTADGFVLALLKTTSCVLPHARSNALESSVYRLDQARGVIHCAEQTTGTSVGEPFGMRSWNQTKTYDVYVATQEVQNFQCSHPYLLTWPR